MFEDKTLTEDIVAEIRKHPGIVGGTVAILAGVGFATLFLRQRTGPRRYEVIRDRLDPRVWADELSLGERLGSFGRRVRDDAADVADVTRDRAADFGERARDFGHDLGDHARDLGDRARDLADEARDRFDRWRGKRGRRRQQRAFMNATRDAASNARDFAQDHAREGAALLTVALIAAAIGAIALENRKVSGE
ncbi:hypothetical protein [uncultured Brevundimonas sp.]|uniref:hypothetical protein n=1 Tax=uncultured Brevundimonas sp. TaxID=213418 RepID=UPI00261F830B|nr:hypothetical protein [uncultured Brevundimonas sp.]